MDVHVPAAVTEGLRRKLLDVRTAQADAAGQLSDEELLERATTLGSVVLTQDADFLEIAVAAAWHSLQRSAVRVAGHTDWPDD
jgi:predicted nuclease of predicted toxin-antitoxin system